MRARAPIAASTRSTAARAPSSSRGAARARGVARAAVVVGGRGFDDAATPRARCVLRARADGATPVTLAPSRRARADAPRGAVVARGKKKLRGFLKKAGDAAEAALVETSRLRVERTLIDNELREIREERGEIVLDAAQVQMELLKEIRSLTKEVRELKEEVRAATTRGGTLDAGSSMNAVKGEKSDADMLAMLGVGGGGLGAVDVEASEPIVEPVLDVSEWRGDGTDRSGEWPLVKKNDDDIYLMTTIHYKLNEAGFWAGEDDEEDMFFGETTKVALLYFQANAGIPETGLVDSDTWRALLGEEAFKWGPPPGAIAFDESKIPEVVDKVPSVEAPAAEAATANPKYVMAEEDYAPDDYDPFGHDDERGAPQGASFETNGKIGAHKWPVLREDDGGMEVHKMQVILSEQGFDSGEEDMEYWYFGSTTSAALLTFQASNRLPETGITDLNTWRALLGDELLDISPADALERIGHGGFEHDLSRTDKVFLLGEQRYET